MTIPDDHRRKMMKKRVMGILFGLALMMVMMPALGAGMPVYADDESHTHDGITFQPWESENSLPTEAGSYFLVNNVTLTNTWSVPEGTAVNLCLNGKTISCTEDITDEVCRVGSGMTLNLYDETADEGCIQGNINTDGVVVEGAFNMYGGTIRNCGGDGVEVNLSGSVSGAAFTMNGGTIEQCGYGVNAGRTVVMNGGTVTDNDCGVNVLPSGTFSVKGSPVIAGNTQHDLILVKDGDSYPKAAFSVALAEDADICVEIADANGDNYGGIFTVSTGGIKAKDYMKYFKSGSDKYIVKANGNELELAEVTEYPLWIKGTQVTDTNKGNVLGDGKVSYDPDKHTLTLDGANITADTEKQYKFSAIHYGDDKNGLIIDATKDSTVTGAGYAEPKDKTSYGISSESLVTVRGKLTAAGGEASVSVGVFVPAFVVEDKAEAKVRGDSGGVYISEGTDACIIVSGKLTAEGGDYGIYFYPDSTGSGRVTSVTVNSGAELTATGGMMGIVTNSDNGYVEIKKGAKVRAAGGTYGAVDGTVKNAVPGLGWTDPEGTEGKTFFDIHTQGRSLGDDIKCAEFPAPAASVKTAPEAKDRKYTGQEQVLVTEGTAEGGTMQYALGKDGTTPPERGWSTSVPAGKDIGVYYVWYKAVGDNAHIDSAAACVTVTISEKGPDPDESTVTFDLNGGTLDGQTGTVVKKYENGTVITLPAPVRDGYTFDYWAGSRYNAGDKYTVDGDHTFTAVCKTGAGGGSDSGTGSGSSSGKNGVKTGDDNALAAWIVLLLAALGGTTGMVFARKRKGE